MADPSARRRVLKIIASRDGSVVWSGEIAQGEATIGRSPSSQVVLDDPLVSWTHARVSFGKDGVVFTDCSTNGSFRNGERVTTVGLGPGGLISIPPFEVDLSLERVEDFPHRPLATQDASARQLASTVPESSGPPLSSEGRAAGHTSSEMLVVTRTASRFESSVTVITVAGRLDGYTFGEMQDVLSRVMAEGHRLVVADLAKCQYCDHSGLGVLVNAHVALTGKKGGLRLVGLSPQLKDAIRLLRLDDVLSLAADEKTAVLELARLKRS